MKEIGTTETYDPCFVEDWDKNLLEANIIITKELSDKMIDKIVENKDKIILHHTVTGLGGTWWEPCVRKYTAEYASFKKLIKAGFPLKQYVLRVDPIIPFNRTSLESAHYVLSAWKSWILNQEEDGLTMRCRFSLIDLYPHVKSILDSSSILYDHRIHFSYYPDKYYSLVEKFLDKYRDVFHFEVCAEPGFNKSEFIEILGCASHRDIQILGLNISDYQAPECPQRNTCTCLAKKQILRVKPSRCPHGCKYCFWRS